MDDFGLKTIIRPIPAIQTTRCSHIVEKRALV